MPLVRSTSRIRELAVRASLGAGHWRLTRQLLTENLALALCGGSLALALAWAAIQALPTLGLRDLPRMDEVTIDGWVVTFSLGLSTLTGLLFGAFPAWKISRLDPQQSMQHGNRVLGDRRGSLLRALFVVVQVSLALILVTGAGLLIRSIVALQKADLGFQPENLLTFELPLSGEKGKGENANRYYDEVARRISRLPQVRSVGGINYLPLRGNVFGWALLSQGRDTPGGASLPNAEYRVVSGDLFSALGIRMKTGRGFDGRDNRVAPPVAVINETMARRYWPGEQPIGKQFRLGGPLSMFPWLTVIGIAGDVRYGEVEAAPEPTIYQPLSQARGGSLSIVVLAGIAAGLAGTFALAKVITTLLYGVTPMDPLTIGLVCILLILTTVLASYLPAKRALRIDPVVALRLD